MESDKLSNSVYKGTGGRALPVLIVQLILSSGAQPMVACMIPIPVISFDTDAGLCSKGSTAPIHGLRPFLDEEEDALCSQNG